MVNVAEANPDELDDEEVTELKSLADELLEN